jgi:hypothetical protein
MIHCYGKAKETRIILSLSHPVVGILRTKEVSSCTHLLKILGSCPQHFEQHYGGRANHLVGIQKDLLTHREGKENQTAST